MEKKKSISIIALIAAVTGGGLAISIDNSQNTTNIEVGDTNINIEKGEDYCRLAINACENNIIPEEYSEICPIINLVCPNG